MSLIKPDIRPNNPRFSCGPCTKPLGWSLSQLKHAHLGRYHRSSEGKEKLGQAIELTREILEIPHDYKIAIVPASDTGAMEMAMWSLLGARGVEVLTWESFGLRWHHDITTQLKLDEINHHHADYGAMPNLSAVNFDNDVVFTWNGTSSGVKVPNGDFIPENRNGLTLCDATSAVFAQELDWKKLDATTFSWQKVLGGEAAHGMLVLSPRAVERLESYTPPWPMPKLFRLTNSGKLNDALFEGATINTPSMLAVEDYLISLQWAKSKGGLQGLINKTNENYAVLEDFVENSPWLEYLVQDPANRSNTSVCLKIVAPYFVSKDHSQQAQFISSFCSCLEDEGVAFDIASYRDAPLGLRIWTGATVEKSDVEALCPWLDWAFAQSLN